MTGPDGPAMCPFCGEAVGSPGRATRRVLKVGRRVPWAGRSPKAVSGALLTPHRRCISQLGRTLAYFAQKAAPLADVRPALEDALRRVGG